MKKIVGASIYVGLKDYPLEKNLKYLDMLKEVGVEHVFISSHIPEMHEGFLDELKKVVEYASNIGLKMIVDISKPMYEKIKLPEIYALRLDYGFSFDEIVKMYKDNKFIIELNASTLTKEKAMKFLDAGVDLSKMRVSHNFYPKTYTGSSREKVARVSKDLQDLGLNVALYIPSSNEHRMPIYEGLPTVEEHRFMDLNSILSEVRSLNVNEITFGDAYCSKEELLQAINFDYDVAVIPLKLYDGVTLEERKQLERVHINRTDNTIYFVRSSVRCENSIKPRNTKDRFIGEVTIDNDGFLRYSGEVCIMLKDLGSDERVNVVGKVMCPKETLDTITPGRKFRFEIVE